jgi:hypothetical protein
MSVNPTDQPGATTGETDLSTRYVLVVIIEVIVIASLYWLGRHFG